MYVIALFKHEQEVLQQRISGSSNAACPRVEQAQTHLACSADGVSIRSRNEADDGRQVGLCGVDVAHLPELRFAVV